MHNYDEYPVEECGNNGLLLNTYRLICEYTSKDKPLSSATLRKIAENDHKFSGTEHTWNSYIRDLEDMGFIDVRNPGRLLCSCNSLSNQTALHILEAITSNPLMEGKEKDDMVAALKNLSPIFSHCGTPEMYAIYNDNFQIRQNRILRDAIKTNMTIKAYFTGYGADGHLETQPSDNGRKEELNPYRVVMYKDHFYLACSYYNDDRLHKKKLYFIRADLLKDVELTEHQSQKQNVEGLTDFEAIYHIENENERQQRFNHFINAHLYMSSGTLMDVTMKIRVKKGQLPDWPKYTILKDNFTNWKIMDPEHDINIDGKGTDIVHVYTTEYSAITFALSYADRVTILSPRAIKMIVSDFLIASLKTYKE